VTSSPEPFELEGADGGPRRGDLYHPEPGAAAGASDPGAALGGTPPGRPVVIHCHGSRGYKDWGFLPLLASRIAEEGLPAVTFSFTDSGISGRGGAFDEPERYRKGTYGSELEDLRRVADWVALRHAGADGSAPRLGIAGHSRGGAIAILHAAGDPRVRCLASLAAPSRIGVWPDRYFEAWRRGEPVMVRDFRTRSELRLGPEIYEDLERHRSRYDVGAALESIECPLLIVQGDRDRSVPVEEAREIASRVPAVLCELHVIEGAGHGFQAGDEIRRIPPQLAHMVELVTAWMRRWLRGRG
jgi:pimeloyl-ACP methyl ester carboxylesterase